MKQKKQSTTKPTTTAIIAIKNVHSIVTLEFYPSLLFPVAEILVAIRLLSFCKTHRFLKAVYWNKEDCLTLRKDST